jgi:hypothetical protein
MILPIKRAVQAIKKDANCTYLNYNEEDSLVRPQFPLQFPDTEIIDQMRSGLSFLSFDS